MTVLPEGVVVEEKSRGKGEGKVVEENQEGAKGGKELSTLVHTWAGVVSLDLLKPGKRGSME